MCEDDAEALRLAEAGFAAGVVRAVWAGALEAKPAEAEALVLLEPACALALEGADLGWIMFKLLGWTSCAWAVSWGGNEPVPTAMRATRPAKPPQRSHVLQFSVQCGLRGVPNCCCKQNSGRNWLRAHGTTPASTLFG
ncbi:hypothetical protein THIX_60955 [Thiomonas sp. X19]|nr:hypothetical protein THIX_60955 [Thiomonas sp. X19]